MSKAKIYLILSIICLVSVVIISKADEFNGTQPIKVKVLDKLTENSSGYKYGSFKYRLVVLNDSIGAFDFEVSPVTYSLTKIGDIKTFNLNPQLYKERGAKDNFLFFGMVILGFAYMFFFMSSIVFSLK